MVPLTQLAFAQVAFAQVALATGLPFQEVQTSEITRELAGGYRAKFQARTERDGSEVPHGDFTLYDPEGRRRVEGFYEDGLRAKKWRFLDEDRQTILRGSYREGLRSGSWTLKYPDGELRAEGKYKGGRMSGAWRFYERDGDRDEPHWGRYEPYVHEPEDRLAGQGISPVVHGQRLDGYAHGVWTFYWPGGQPMLEAEFIRGVPAGAWRFWHPDGSPDPWLFQDVRAESSWPRSLSEDPLPIGLERSAGASPLGFDVTAYAAFAQSPELSSELLGLSEATLTTGEALPGPLADLELDALAPALELLRSCDYAVEEDRERARLALAYAAKALHGHELLPAEQARDPRALKLAAMRAHAVYHLWRASPVQWALELEFGSRPDPGSGDLQGGVLSRPPLGAILEHAPAPVPPAYVARLSGSTFLEGSGGKELERSIAKGLNWLEANQRIDGSWAAADDLYDVGVTALALLSFLAEGNTLTEGSYSHCVDRGVRWLLAQQDLESGRFQRWVLRTDPGTKKQTRLISFSDLYNHAIATQAICELAALSPSPTLIERARPAVQLIHRAQDADYGWRYEVPSDGDNDSSMTTWMSFALLAADRLGAPIAQLPNCPKAERGPGAIGAQERCAGSMR